MTPVNDTIPRPKLRAAIPRPGGKSRPAHLIWARFGEVHTFIDPFCGTNAILYASPRVAPIEIVNDKDVLLVNFLRAVKHDPKAVASFADWPITEADLEARHRWICDRERSAQLAARVRRDPDFFCARTAGFWAWGLAAWIGPAWCRREFDPAKPEAFRDQLPNVINSGCGVHRRTVNLVEWFGELAARMRHTRILCHDWSRVVRPSIVKRGKLTAIALDPPYSAEAGRDDAMYTEDDLAVAHAARQWAIEHGDDPKLRIALCGYEGEHVMPASWTEIAWKAHGGFSCFAKGATRAKANRHRERIWFSPHCLDVGELPGGVIVHQGKPARAPGRRTSGAHRHQAATRAKAAKAPRRKGGSK